MTSSSKKLERKRALQARTRSAKRLLIIAFVCIGLGVLGAAVMAVLAVTTTADTVSMLSGPIALLALAAFVVLLRREAITPRKTSFLGRAGFIGLAVCAAGMATAQVLSWTGADSGASLAALLTLVPALAALGCLGSWALRETNADGVSTSSIMGTITSTHT